MARKRRDASGVINDPENYARMQVPHETPEEAQAAWDGFWKDVYEARKKHRIAQAVVVGQINISMDGQTTGIQVLGSMGDPESVIRMLAWGYGKTKANYDEELRSLLVSGIPDPPASEEPPVSGMM